MKVSFIEMTNIQLEAMMINFNETEKFKKEFKYFFKKYLSLEEDFDILKLVLKTEPCLVGNNCNMVHEERTIKIFKKRMQCRSLRGTLRVVYAYNKTLNSIEFIEMYRHIDNKADYNRERVNEYLKNK
jgi:hypothetical protein